MHLEHSSNLGKVVIATHQNMETYIIKVNSNSHFFFPVDMYKALSFSASM